MTGEIENKLLGVQEPDNERCWNYPLWTCTELVSLANADCIREKTNSERYAPISDDFDLAGELTIALCDFKVLTTIHRSQPSLVDTKDHISQLPGVTEKLQKILYSTGGYALSLLHKHGAFRSTMVDLIHHPVPALPGGKLALEEILEALRTASIGAASELKGERPRKTYETDTAVGCLADVYEKATGGKAYVKDDQDTYFMAFLRASLPLFEVDIPHGYTVRRILQDRKKHATN